MAKFNRAKSTPAASMASIGAKLASSNAAKLGDKSAVRNVIGLEGFADEVATCSRDQVQSGIRQQIETELAATGMLGLESLSPAQLEAGSVILMASSDPVAYAERAMVAVESFADDAPMHTAGMDVDAQAIALEYFNEADLDKHMGASFAFNVQAAKQGKFAESFFPTIVVDPSECGLLVEINKTMIHRAVRHAINEKDSRPYNRRNILDAATDPTVLDDQSIIFVPYRKEDNSNAEYFVPAAKFAGDAIDVGDYSVPTAPLAFNTGVKHLLSLSAHPGLVSTGILDESDEFDGRVALDKLYVTFNAKGGADDAAQVVEIKTLNLAHASFNKAQEGDGRDMILNFRGAKFHAGTGIKDIAGSPVSHLEDLIAAGYRLQYTVNMTSNFNLQTGEEEMTVGSVRIVAVYNADGDKVSMDSGAVKTLLANLEIKPFGYVYKATRSNSNRRTKGILVDNVASHERYKITLGSPLTSRKPIGTVDDSRRLNDLITAARLRNDNLAVTKLLSFTDTLKEVVAARGDEYEIPSIEGVGRHFVAPWFEEFYFDAQELVASLESQDVSDNLANALLGVLRSQIVTAYRDARFQPALEMLSGYTISKPSVLIGTDPYTANWLWTKGDLRTLGDQFEYSIVTTNDQRFRDRIQWVFTIETADNGFSPLNFGNHLWVPELITNTNLTRTEATANELTVQPRNYHIVNCPITGVIFPRNLKNFVTSKPVVSVDVAEVVEVAVKEVPTPAPVNTK